MPNVIYVAGVAVPERPLDPPEPKRTRVRCDCRRTIEYYTSELCSCGCDRLICVHCQVVCGECGDNYAPQCAHADLGVCCQEECLESALRKALKRLA